MKQEERIRLSISKFLRTVGFGVWNLSQPRRTMQSAGLPDLIAIGCGMVLHIEVKTEKGKQRPAQIEYGNEVNANGGTYIVLRGAVDAFDYLVKVGVINETKDG